MLVSVKDYLKENFPDVKYGEYTSNSNNDVVYFKELYSEGIYTEVWDKGSCVEVKSFVVGENEQPPIALVCSKVASLNVDEIFAKVKSDTELLKKII